MSESDVITFKSDRRVNGIPREAQRRKTGAAPGQAALWSSPETRDLTIDIWGQYPKRFLTWAVSLLRCAPCDVLHVCSGSLPRGTGRARVDIRSETMPDIVADGRRLPFSNEIFKAVLIDPPYTVEYARDLYQTEYPRPSHLLAEASRVVRSCGRIGILHFLVPMPPPGCRLELVRGVTTGCGYRIQAFSIFEKRQDGLFAEDR